MAEKQETFDQIRDELNKLIGRLEDAIGKKALTGAPAGLIGGFATDIGVVLNELEDLEKEIVSKGVGSLTRLSQIGLSEYLVDFNQ
ncbi:MAG: hypothetical protein QMC90_02985 [Dehalococcoidales bacterium]|nr:hypothetical protein [Dehalococcoidales bacterium]